MRVFESIPAVEQDAPIVLRGARCALGPEESTYARIEIAGGGIRRILKEGPTSQAQTTGRAEIDLRGYLIMPGLINAHDHLEFALYPRLAYPPYRNYIEWGEDIHKKLPEMIAEQHAIPRTVRLWWGGIRNLLCGATTVCHHNPLWSELQRSDFPVRVVRDYGWAHSVTFGGDLRAARVATPQDSAFIVHACEGVDELAREELWKLDKLQLLDATAVLVHGLAIDPDGIALLMERRSSVIICPSSNEFLFRKLPDLSKLGKLDRVALGNDSPLTAAGDLLDEIRFAIDRCKVSMRDAYRMVTTVAAAVLRLKGSEGSLVQSGVADLIATRDTDVTPAERLAALFMDDIDLVMIGGRVQLASDSMLERLPPSLSEGLESLLLGTVNRWLRAPTRELLRSAEEVLEARGVRLGGRQIRIPGSIKVKHVH